MEIIKSQLFAITDDGSGLWDKQFYNVSTTSDMNIMNLLVERKKVLGLIIIMNLINFVNMAFPTLFYSHPSETS